MNEKRFVRITPAIEGRRVCMCCSVRKGFRTSSSDTAHDALGTSPGPTTRPNPIGSRGFSREGSIATAMEVFADSPPASVREPSVETALEVFADSPPASVRGPSAENALKVSADSLRPGASRLSVTDFALGPRATGAGPATNPIADCLRPRHSGSNGSHLTTKGGSRADLQSVDASADGGLGSRTSRRSAGAALVGSMATPSITSDLSGKTLTELIAVLSDTATTTATAMRDQPSEAEARADVDTTSREALTFLKTGEYEHRRRASTAAGRASIASAGAGDSAAGWPRARQSARTGTRAGGPGPPQGKDCLPVSARAKQATSTTRLGMGDYVRSKTRDKLASAPPPVARAESVPDPKGASSAMPTALDRDEDADVVEIRVQGDRTIAVVRDPAPLHARTEPAARSRSEPRRQRSAALSLKRPSASNPYAARPSVLGLMEHVDKALPQGLRQLLLELQGHCDLGGKSFRIKNANENKQDFCKS
ncbi:hypothetical protein ONE63_010793 [Megalurothrips usitatus]|uniref:Uncharacterized protein n=1 Tax=Megalurothrips usitatus TaxID=439358 RepID=A0AAV7XI86_9NEOP|nr:hypothetical protein ONE63_010793 [Megalurothrips usitatus]